MNDRDTALRTALVDLVDATPAPRPRFSRRTLAIGLAAFVAAGLVSGGVTAAAAVSASAPDPVLTKLALTGRYDVESTRYGKLAGAASTFEGSGATELHLGPAPAGATLVEVTFQCLEPGRFTVDIGSLTGVLGDPSCPVSTEYAPSTTNPDSVGVTVSGAHDGIVSVRPAGSARYAIWASWATQPAPAKPSAQQQDEIADGTVTRAEYVAAFNRLEGCMAQAGYPMGLIPGNEETFQYSTTDASDPVFMTQCYPREFEKVDGLWQTEHPQP